MRMLDNIAQSLSPGMLDELGGRVDITNVAKWYFEINDSLLPDKDRPIALPPWPIAWIEYHAPAYTNWRGELTPWDFDFTGIGFKLTTRQIKKDTVYSFLGRSFSWDDRAFVEAVDDGAEWGSSAQLWLMFPSGSVLKTGSIGLFYREDGSLVDGIGFSYPAPGVAPPHITPDKYMLETFLPLYWPVQFAISLMHAKNVELVDKPIPRHVRRRAARRGEPVIQYKTLVIEPFKKQVRNEAAASGESEIHRALHICRGHFATYTEDAPLFGKYTGTYWRPMHVRGRADVGIVHKDYKIVADDKQPVAPSSSSPSSWSDGDGGEEQAGVGG